MPAEGAPSFGVALAAVDIWLTIWIWLALKHRISTTRYKFLY